MPRATCYVFDLDDTLYPERQYVRSGFEAVESAVPSGNGIHNFADLCWDRFLRDERGGIFDAVLQSCFGHADKQLVAEMVHVYRSHAPQIQLFPDAEQTLRRLQCQEARLALITDGPRDSQRAKIKALSLDRILSPVVVTAELGGGRSKPHPAAFELVQQAYGPDLRSVYVGDNPRKDFAGPNQLGWVTIRIQRPDGLYSLDREPTPAHAPQHCVESLAEVLRIVK